MGAKLKEHGDKIKAMHDHISGFSDKIDTTLTAASEMNSKIETFKEATDNADQVMKDIQGHISLFSKRAKA